MELKYLSLEVYQACLNMELQHLATFNSVLKQCLALAIQLGFLVSCLQH